MHQVVVGVRRSLGSAVTSPRFPRLLTWEDARATIEGFSFPLGTGSLVLPKEWATVLRAWSTTTVDDFGRAQAGTSEVAPRGYVFTAPGDPTRPIPTEVLPWLSEAERDHLRTLYCVAEAAIRGLPEFNLTWYNSAICPAAVRFLDWFGRHSTYTPGSLKVILHKLRYWLSAFGPDGIASPEDPIVWSAAFGRAGSPPFPLVRFWEQWSTWALEDMGVEVPPLPGIPPSVVEAYRELEGPGDFWTNDLIERAAHNGKLAALLNWATAKGTIKPTPKATPLLPRFAGGQEPVRRDDDVLDRVWNYASEVHTIKERGGWWDQPRMLFRYPGVGAPSAVSMHRARIVPGVPVGRPVTLEGVTEAETCCQIIVPRRILTQVVAHAEALLASTDPHVAPPAVTAPPVIPALPPAPLLTANREEPPKDDKKRERKDKAKGKKGPPKKVHEVVPDVEPVRAQVQETAVVPVVEPEAELVVHDLSAAAAIAAGWDRRAWLGVYRRVPGCPNPYEIEKGPDGPRFRNGFKVPPEWIPRMSDLWRRAGIVTAADREIPGLDAYTDVFWTAEGEAEWEAAENASASQER